MDCTNKYIKYINNNFKTLHNKKILLTGGTGSIGESVVTYLSMLNNELILLVRNIDLATKLKDKLTNLYHNKITLIYFDYLDKESINKALDIIKSLQNLDIFINISGIYHQHYELIKGIEKTYFVNFICPVYFINKLFNYFDNLKIVIVSSITATAKLIGINTLFNDKYNFLNTLNNIKNKTKRYAISKHLLMSYFLYLKIYLKKNIIFTHPGVSTTNLFSKKNNAYNKLFYLIVPKLMKLIFMNPAKASLSIMYGSNLDSLDYSYWIGPKGLFHIYGYPNLYKFNKRLLTKFEIENTYKIVNKLIDEL